MEAFDERVDRLELMFTELDKRLGRLERVGYIIVGLMVGVGVLDVSKFVQAIAG